MQAGHLPKDECILFLTVIQTAIEDAKEPAPKVPQAALEWLMQDQVAASIDE